MNIIKTSEKVLIWMHRTGRTQIEIAEALGTTRQTFAKNLKENMFSASDMMNLKRLGFRD